MAIVDRNVTDVISLVVEADTEEEAIAKAKEVVELYPKQHTVLGVPYCYIENRTHGDVVIKDIFRAPTKDING